MSRYSRSRKAKDFTRYDKGETLILSQYSPVAPYGLEQYIDNPPPPDLPPGWIRNFDPNQPVPTDTQLILQIVRLLSGGKDAGSQVLLCNILTPPSRIREDHAPFSEQVTDQCGRLSAPNRVVVKVYDTFFFPDEAGAPISNNELADARLSREAGAYKYLYENGLTGHPHFTAQYHGSWALKFSLGQTALGYEQYSCAAAVVIEYIEGFSIEELCVRDEDTEDLIPPSGWVTFHESPTRGSIRLKFNKEFRKEVVRRILDASVRHVHIGVRHDDAEPENLFITKRDGLDDLNADFRVVLLDLTLTEVWSTTEDGQNPMFPVYCLQKLPLPVHPWHQFCAEAMDLFTGWFPSGPESDETIKEFDEWLTSDEGFGPLVEGAGGKGNYSIYATLDEIEKEEEEAKVE